MLLVSTFRVADRDRASRNPLAREKVPLFDTLCESGCAYNGITDVVTNLLMKVQHVSVYENSVHNFCVSLMVVWTWNFLLSLSLGKCDGICSMAWGYTSLVSTPSLLCTWEVCQSQITLLPRCGCTPVVVQRWRETLNSVGSRFCVFSHLVCIPLVFVSPLHWCRAHTHLYMSLSRTCVLICPTTVICLCFTRVGPLVSRKSCVFPFHLDVIARLLTDLETRRFGILLFHRTLFLQCDLHDL